MDIVDPSGVSEEMVNEIFAVMMYEQFLHTHDLHRLTDSEVNELIDLWEKQRTTQIATGYEGY